MGINQILGGNPLYAHLKPKLKQHLSFVILWNYYEKFQHFFYEEELGFQANTEFVT